jgi:hypothetical protein
MLPDRANRLNLGALGDDPGIGLSIARTCRGINCPDTPDLAAAERYPIILAHCGRCQADRQDKDTHTKPPETFASIGLVNGNSPVVVPLFRSLAFSS